MNRKKILIFGIAFMLTLGCAKEKSNDLFENNLKLMEMDEYKKIVIDKVDKLEVMKYTEAGIDEKTYTLKDDIISIYNNLKQIQIGKEVSKACDDNTTKYIFYLENDKYSIEIECEWLVLNGKRYEIIK